MEEKREKGRMEKGGGEERNGLNGGEGKDKEGTGGGAEGE
jgi:hypothetical protein